MGTEWAYFLSLRKAVHICVCCLFVCLCVHVGGLYPQVFLCIIGVFMHF